MTELTMTDRLYSLHDVPPCETRCADQPPPAAISTTAVVEMLLKDQDRLNALVRDTDCQRELLPRFMAVAIGGFAMYGVVTTCILNGLAWKTHFWLPHLPRADWNDASALNLALGYTLGLVAANGICLPSFYFYGLLAGIRITMLGVATHALKGMAAGAVALIGFLPIYVALALTAIVFPLGSVWNGVCVGLGLALPFVAGILGATNLYRGFVALADCDFDQRRGARLCFVRRLMLAWVCCATCVTPVVIYSLWDYLSDLTAAGVPW